jgi:transcriptional regulator with XRE-family HTH domain
MVKQYRNAVGMTQEEFAEEIGLSHVQVSCIERGAKGISFDKLAEMRRKFHFSIDDMIPIAEYDDTLKDKWIEEINGNLKTMDSVTLAFIKRMIRALRG